MCFGRICIDALSDRNFIDIIKWPWIGILKRICSSHHNLLVLCLQHNDLLLVQIAVLLQRTFCEFITEKIFKRKLRNTRIISYLNPLIITCIVFKCLRDIFIFREGWPMHSRNDRCARNTSAADDLELFLFEVDSACPHHPVFACWHRYEKRFLGPLRRFNNRVMHMYHYHFSCSD